MMASREIRHLSARVPADLAERLEVLRARLRAKHLSDALVLALERGLDALEREAAGHVRLDVRIARIDHLMVTAVAILNVVHELDPEAVVEMREAVLRRVGS
jgi:hypothetical protein